jgi:hypothetical protein
MHKKKGYEACDAGRESKIFQSSLRQSFQLDLYGSIHAIQYQLKCLKNLAELLKGHRPDCAASSFTMALRKPTLGRLLLNAGQQIRHYAAPGEGSIPPAKQKYVPTSGTYPKGFFAASAHVGVKASNTKFDDLALVASETPCAGAAVFTKNKFQAAPVTVSRDMLQRRQGKGIRAVVVNSGCANAVTGKGGIEDAIKMGEETDRCFDEDYNKDKGGSSTIVMSTGVIGQRYVIICIWLLESMN